MYRTRKSRRAIQLLGIAVLAIAFMGADVDARFNKLGHQLMCMCGCNQVLLECNHVGCSYSERMRGELTASLERGDNDSLAALVAIEMSADLLILLTDVDGVFDRPPSEEGAQVIDIFDESAGFTAGEKSGQGRGGMAAKVSFSRFTVS